jgi:hypothetical protein
MRKKKKQIRHKRNFYFGVALYFLFLVISSAMVAIILSSNIHPAAGSDQKVSTASADYSSDPSQFYKTMDEVGDYINNNITVLAEKNEAGGASSTVDNVDFINVNRALVFYHENSDKYLAEVVFNDNNNQPNIERFILKIKNDNDYSNGVYGSD